MFSPEIVSKIMLYVPPKYPFLDLLSHIIKTIDQTIRFIMVLYPF